MIRRDGNTNVSLLQYIEEFDTDHIYNCDPFNENEPGRSDLNYLRNVSHSIFSAMHAVDSRAIWWVYAREDIK